MVSTSANSITPVFERFQEIELLTQLLNDRKGATVRVSTFSVNEYFIRRVVQLKDQGVISRITLLADSTVHKNARSLVLFASNVFDEVFLTTNHSKLLLIENAGIDTAVVSSANMDQGRGFESALIITYQNTVSELTKRFDEICKNDAVRI